MQIKPIQYILVINPCANSTTLLSLMAICKLLPHSTSHLSSCLRNSIQLNNTSFPKCRVFYTLKNSLSLAEAQNKR